MSSRKQRLKLRRMEFDQKVAQSRISGEPKEEKPKKKKTSKGKK